MSNKNQNVNSTDSVENAEKLNQRWTELRQSIQIAITAKQLAMLTARESNTDANKAAYKAALEAHAALITEIKIVRPAYKEMRGRLQAAAPAV